MWLERELGPGNEGPWVHAKDLILLYRCWEAENVLRL